MTRDEQILSALRAVDKNGSQYRMTPNKTIPAQEIKPNVLRNAQSACQIKGKAQGNVVALLDCTIFGSGKTGFLLTSEGIYASKDLLVTNLLGSKRDFSMPIRFDALERTELCPSTSKDGSISYLTLFWKDGSSHRVFANLYAQYISALLNGILSSLSGVPAMASGKKEAPQNAPPKSEPAKPAGPTREERAAAAEAKGMEAMDAQNWKAALSCFREAYNLGKTDTAFYISLMLQADANTYAQLDEAIQWGELAQKNGDKTAPKLLAKLYDRRKSWEEFDLGRSLELSGQIEKSILHYDKAARLGNGAAAYNAAVLTAKNAKYEDDLGKAIAFAQRSCELKYERAPAFLKKLQDIDAMDTGASKQSAAKPAPAKPAPVKSAAPKPASKPAAPQNPPVKRPKTPFDMALAAFQKGDYEAAVQGFLPLSQQGDPQAAYCAAASLVKLGKLSEAANEAKQAKALGNPDANGLLANIHLRMGGISDPESLTFDELYKLAKDTYREEDFHLGASRAMFEAAASRGNGAQVYVVAAYLYDHYPSQKSLLAAWRYGLKAHAMGEKRAADRLIRIRNRLEDTLQNQFKANWRDHMPHAPQMPPAASLSSAEAVRSGQIAYDLGDVNTALEYFRSAADRGDREGCYMTAAILLINGTPQFDSVSGRIQYIPDYAQAEQYALNAQKLGLEKATRVLILIWKGWAKAADDGTHSTGDPEQDEAFAERCFRKAYDAGDTDALLELFYIQRNRAYRSGDLKLWQEALRQAKKASAAIQTRDTKNLVQKTAEQIYSAGDKYGGKDGNPAKERYYREAAEAGCGEAAYFYACALQDKAAGISDLKEALGWADRASELGYERSKYLRGSVSFDIGVKYCEGDNYGSAIPFFKTAAELGDSTAAYNVAICLEHRSQSRSSLQEALEWVC
ncbi:MAG: sel1 repeat family protein, partial [Oscillospiraceae bacterium]|nr:sel1 repeat family protein [Oscillospiraceae bacterium]